MQGGIAYLPPDHAGRHGFYTEMRLRQGVGERQLGVKQPMILLSTTT
jgi:hypothetical protein